MEFGLATKTYDPECKYAGGVVHIKAADPSSFASTLPNEDYNISKVLSKIFNRLSLFYDKQIPTQLITLSLAVLPGPRETSCS